MVFLQPKTLFLKLWKGSGQGCAEANLEEIIPEDVIDSQQGIHGQFDSNIEYRIEYEDDTNSFFSKNWIDCQEIIEENEKESDILLIDQGMYNQLCNQLLANWFSFRSKPEIHLRLR